MRTSFQAELRLPTNRTGLKRMRKEGRLPGIVFGTNEENQMVQIPMADFQRWTRRGGSGMLNLEIKEQGAIPVLLEAIQRDPVTRELLHVDFLRVRSDQPVRTKVPIEYVGTAKGSKEGGIVQTQGTTIELEALPGDLPSVITVEISELGVGDTIRVGEVALPSGVTLVSLAEELLVSVVAPKVEQKAEEEPEAETV